RHERADALKAVAVLRGVLHLPQRLAVHALEDLVEQVLLRGDVVVEAALEDPDRVSDVLDRRRLVALLVEDPGGRLEDLVVASPRGARSARLLRAGLGTGGG